MKTGGVARPFILAFVLALVGYVLCYHAIEYRRTRKGPWEVGFTKNAGGEPTLIINQAMLGVTNVQIIFPGETTSATNPAEVMVFNQPQPVPYNVPFGQCVFLDLTFLPGTVTFRLFGHEIELLPRVLMLDHDERPWEPGSVRVLKPLPAGTK